jgi:hypothetical protein
MKSTYAVSMALISCALLAQAGCASGEQWAAWRQHNTHFASGQHAGFSLRNQGTEAERVRSTDPEQARVESWWGRQLPVAWRPGGGS